MGSYGSILRVPRLGALLLTGIVARLSMGIDSLAVVLFLQSERGSFGIAGVVAGAIALGSSAAAPLTSRLVDRLGPLVLVVLGLLHAVGLIGIVLAGPTAPGAALVPLALLTGVAFPPASSVLYAQYPKLLADRPELLRSAYALDSVATELIFISGPILTAVLVALVAPGAALVLSAACVSIGTAAFVAVLPAAQAGGELTRAPAGLLGALRSPGVRTLAVVMVPVGFAFGTLEVSVPAFATAEGAPELAGVLLAIWAAGSAAGGLVYGSRPRHSTVHEAHLRVALLLPLGMLPVVLAVSPLTMALLIIPAGIFIAPLLATRNELVGTVAPAGSQTEAYAWPLTAIVAGISLGAAVAGIVVDASGWRSAIAMAAVAAAVGGAVSFARRGTLRPAAVTAG
jgi:MFS family permease